MASTKKLAHLSPSVGHRLAGTCRNNALDCLHCTRTPYDARSGCTQQLMASLVDSRAVMLSACSDQYTLA
eukprot:m.135645 g.135645  ORF g.135645 m.135645 type:complete len:70 (-) comp9889_c0_seq2:104-313(-)